MKQNDYDTDVPEKKELCLQWKILDLEPIFLILFFLILYFFVLCFLILCFFILCFLILCFFLILDFFHFELTLQD